MFQVIVDSDDLRRSAILIAILRPIFSDKLIGKIIQSDLVVVLFQSLFEITQGFFPKAVDRQESLIALFKPV